MYQPPHFREDRLDVQHALIRAHPLALLVTVGDAGIEANPLPFLLDAEASPLGTLRAHVARANPQWRSSIPRGRPWSCSRRSTPTSRPPGTPPSASTARSCRPGTTPSSRPGAEPRVIEDPAWLGAQIRALTARA